MRHYILYCNTGKLPTEKADEKADKMAKKIEEKFKINVVGISVIEQQTYLQLIDID